MPRHHENDTAAPLGTGGSVIVSTPPDSANNLLEPVTGQLMLVDNSSGDLGVPPAILLRRSNVLVGRAANSDVSLNSLQISRRHCCLEYLHNKWFVRDLSTNGMTVAGMKLIKDQLYTLNHGDIVQLVPTGTLSYRFSDASREVQNPPMPITIDSDIESLLSVDPNEEEIDKSIKNEDEPDNVEVIEDHEFGALKSKSRNSPSKRRSSSVHSTDSHSDISNKKQKTDNDHLILEIARLEKENAVLKTERVIEREEFLQKRETEVVCFKEQYKEELSKKFQDIMDSELNCCICSCVFVEPVISPSCGHTYCHYCITEWLKKKAECPICRRPIKTSVHKHVELGNFICKMYEALGEDINEKRDAQIKDRQSEKEAAINNSRMQPNGPINYPPDVLFSLEMLNAIGNANSIRAAVNGRRGRRNNPAAAAATTAPAGNRRSGRNRRNQDNNPSGLPGGPPVTAYQMIPGMINMNPNVQRGAPHPYFHVPQMPQQMHNPFPQIFNNNQFVHNNNEVMLID